MRHRSGRLRTDVGSGSVAKLREASFAAASQPKPDIYDAAPPGDLVHRDNVRSCICADISTSGTLWTLWPLLAPADMRRYFVDFRF